MANDCRTLQSLLPSQGACLAVALAVSALSAQSASPGTRLVRSWTPTQLGLVNVADARMLSQRLGIVVSSTGPSPLAWIPADLSKARVYGANPSRFYPRMGIVDDTLVWLGLPKSGSIQVFSGKRGQIAERATPTELRDGEGIPLPLVGPAIIGLFTVGIRGDQRLVHVTGIGRIAPPPGWPARPNGSTGAFVLTDLDGRLQRFLAWEPGNSECRVGSFAVPFCSLDRVAVSPSMDAIVVASLDSQSGDSARIRVTRIAVGDEAPQEVTFWSRQARVSPSQADSARSWLLANGPPNANATRADAIRRLPIPEFRPAFEDLVVGSDGLIALVVRTGRDRRDMVIMSSNLIRIAQRSLPSGVRLVDVRGDRALAISGGGAETQQLQLLEWLR